MYNHGGERERPKWTLTLPQYSSVKSSGLFWNCYILVYIRNCGVLDFLEFDDKWHGTRFRVIMTEV
jgi:hypothetical protein